MCRDKEEILEIQLYIYPCIRLNRLPASIVKKRLTREGQMWNLFLYFPTCVFSQQLLLPLPLDDFILTEIILTLP